MPPLPARCPPEAVPVMMIDYMGPSLDTTIFAIAGGVWLFASHPDQWDLVRDEPSLIPGAINEILRIEALIQGFSRYVARDYDLNGVRLPAGSRAIVFYGAANRDPQTRGELEQLLSGLLVQLGKMFIPKRMSLVNIAPYYDFGACCASQTFYVGARDLAEDPAFAVCGNRRGRSFF